MSASSVDDACRPTLSAMESTASLTWPIEVRMDVNAVSNRTSTSLIPWATSLMP